MRSLILLAAVLALSVLPAHCQSQTNPGGQGANGATNTLTAIPATSTKVTLTAPSNYITVINTSTTTTLYFSEVSPATTSSTPILPSSAYNYNGVALPAFWVIGSAASGSYGVAAH